MLWFAPVALAANGIKPPKTFACIQKEAKMSAVAIPLKCALKENDPDAPKHCVTANWWQERMRRASLSFRHLILNDTTKGISVKMRQVAIVNCDF